MIDEHKEDLASLYVLGLLSGEELAAFEAALESDAELRALATSLQNTAAQLAYTVPAAEPSAQLRSRIFDSIDKLTTKPAAPAKIAKPAFRTSWAIAAALGMAACFFGLMWMQASSALRLEKDRAEAASLSEHRLEEQLSAMSANAARQIADLRRENSLDQLKIAKLAALNGNSPDAVAIAVWNPSKQEGVLTVEDLPRITEDQSYQLWVIDAHHKKPVNGGVFSVDQHGRARLDFRPSEPTEDATQFAISRERKGGVPEREGPIVAAGAL